MCGICGFVGIEDKGQLQRMTESFVHRGPDGRGIYFDGDVGLAHRRLAIIDLETGDQPIHNEDSSIWIVFNGEIYNYKELQAELISKGHRFYTQSDTEVIVHLYEEYGKDFVKYLNGIFAFALWDSQSRELLLVRDRLGVKPLYYAQVSGGLAFASEARAILQLPQIKREIEPVSVDKFLTFRYVPSERTMIKGIKKLLPGHMLSFKNNQIALEPYWKLQMKASKIKSIKHLEEELLYLVQDAVKLQLISDVPVGAYLSGGIDSSLIVALMRKFVTCELNTFSIGFGSDIDETSAALAMAEHLKTEHHERIVKEEDFYLLSEIVRLMDEPIGDAMIIPMFLLSKLAREKVKVVLSGNGADELFGGYIHYMMIKYSELFHRFIPQGLRRTFAEKLVSKIPLALLNRAFPYPAQLGRKGRERLVRYLVTKPDTKDRFFAIASLFSEAERQRLYTPEISRSIEKERERDIDWIYRSRNSLEDVILRDMHEWLPNYILHLEDGASMANSVEARVPYLDHRVVELAFTMPLRSKLNGRANKFILRKIAGDILPQEVAWQRKKAFYTPVGDVFKGPFEDSIRRMLDCSTLVASGFFEPESLRCIFNEKRSGHFLFYKQAMAILILEMWLELFIKGENCCETHSSDSLPKRREDIATCNK